LRPRQSHAEAANKTSLDDDANPADPGNVAMHAEADIEAALSPLFESGRYAAGRSPGR
jgi:hypothetical protein